MNMFGTLNARIALFVVLAGGFIQSTQAVAPRAAIESANAAFAAAVAAGDSKALAALYTVDGQVMPAGSEPIVGREAIEGFWHGALGSGIAQVSLKTLEVFGSGNHFTEVGSYQLLDKTGKLLDRGKYIVIWHRERRQWKLLRDMFSTDLPPQPH